MALQASIAKSIAEAKTSGGGNNLTAKDGNYVLLVKRILCKTDGYTGSFFIPEFDVVESEPNRDGVTPWRPGQDVSCVWAFTAAGAKGDAAKGNTKQFFEALLGVSQDDPKFMELVGQYAGAANDPDSTRARGMLVCASTYHKPVKTGPNAGQDRCYAKFATVSDTDGNSPKEIAERRAQLDASRR